jgi:endonuclease/exonuclease/phosphatase family metal-dependent hydrolase
MELKILDLNMWLLPAPIASDQKKRLQRFIKLVKRLNPDIITLQEVWLRGYIKFIRKNLPGYHLRCPSKGFFNKSGLVTLSKKKPAGFSFQKYAKQKGQSRLEKLATKGYLTIKIHFAKRWFNLVNTHLHSQAPKSKKRITERQFETLMILTQKGDWIVCGDFNLDEARLSQLNHGHFSYHPVKTFTVSAANKYTKSRMNRFGKRNRKLDYTLVRTEPANIKIITRVIQKPLISDHYALFTRLIHQPAQSHQKPGTSKKAKTYK